MGERFIKIYSKRTVLISPPVYPQLREILEIVPGVEIVEEFQTCKFYNKFWELILLNLFVVLVL